PLGAGEQVFRPAVGSLRFGGMGGNVLEIIRFAAANHLCVDLDYDGSTRRIEAYSLRRTLDGNIILHANRSDTGDHRSYPIDRIQGPRSTSQTLAPRYEIELSPIGSLAIPPTTRTANATQARHQASRPRSAKGPIYIYKCPKCQKTFRRTKRDSRLNPHKS